MTNKIEASPTVAISALVHAKESAGTHVYNFGLGEPKVKTPQLIIDAAVQFMNKGDIPYPPAAGLTNLRTAAAAWINNTYKCSYQAKECLVVTGGKFGIFILIQHLLWQSTPRLQPAEILIPAPYWVSYPGISQIFGAKPVILDSSEADGWKLTPQKIRSAHTPNSKILIINNGVNPTGIIYTREEVRQILATAQELNLMVISDEVYSGLVYDSEQEYVSCGSFPEYKDHVAVIQSCSKNFAMTGWRIGFVFTNSEIISALVNLSTQSTTGVSLIVQHAALAALNHASEVTAFVRNAMRARRDVFIKQFAESFGTALPMPVATLYSFISLAQLGISGTNDGEFCYRALNEANVALVPGQAFGKAGYVRFSFATDEQSCINGIKALAQWIKTIK